MKMSDLRTRAEAQNGRSCLVARTSESDETAILTLVDIAEGSEAPEPSDPLIQALMDKLPKPHTIWSIDDRGKWLKAAAMAFNLVYRTAEEKPEQSISTLRSVG
jgi:hypothetical protein